MAPIALSDAVGESPVPMTLAWVIGGTPTYALEGNILSSGAALAWTADLLTGGDVAALIELAGSVPDSGGVTLVPAFAGLGAPHWDRDVHALISGLGEGSGRPQISRAAVDAIGHQIADVVDVIEARTPLRLFRADGGATASALVVQTQADLLGRDVQVGDVAEVSALGAARLAWATLGRDVSWPSGGGAVYHPKTDETERRRRRRHWAGEIARTHFRAAP
jgi:glycerol kinase